MLDTLKNISFIAVYILLLGAIMALGWVGLHLAFDPPAIWMVFYSIVFILGGGLLGAWLWVLIKLPSGLAERFDVIKNKIAAREISSAEMFAEELAGFMVKYFSFFRFDVVSVQVRVKDKPVVIYPEEYKNCMPNVDEMEKISRKTEHIISMGLHELNGVKCHAYMLPVWFGDEWLGFVGIYTTSRLHNITRNFLKEFEELYIDDQLMHVLYYEKSKQKQL